MKTSISSLDIFKNLYLQEEFLQSILALKLHKTPWYVEDFTRSSLSLAIKTCYSYLLYVGIIASHILFTEAIGHSCLPPLG